MGHMHYRMVGAVLDRTVGAFRMAPIGTGDVLPPLVGIPLPHRPRRKNEHDRGGRQQLRQCIRVQARIGRPLGQGDVARGLHELEELGVGDWRTVHPEPFHAHRMGRSLLGVVGIRAHQEAASGDPHHVPRRRAAGTAVRFLLGVGNGTGVGHWKSLPPWKSLGASGGWRRGAGCQRQGTLLPTTSQLNDSRQLDCGSLMGRRGCSLQATSSWGCLLAASTDHKSTPVKQSHPVNPEGPNEG